MKKIWVLLSILLVGCALYPASEQEGLSISDDLAALVESLETEQQGDIQNGSQSGEQGVPSDENPVDEQDDPMQKPLDTEDNLDDGANGWIDSTASKIEVIETELVDLKVDAQDPDMDPITITYSNPLDSEGRWQTTFGDAGEYQVTVSASDGKLSTSERIILVVKKKNVAPQIQNVPSVINAKEGELVKLAPLVTDQNGDDLTLVFSAPFDSNGMWQTDYRSAGDYDVAISVTDGQLSSERKVNVVISDRNQPPSISGLESRIVVQEGDTVVLKPMVSDGDEDDVTVIISEPIGNDGLWETGFTDAGEYSVVVSASDGKDETRREVTVIVQDVNKAPQIISIQQG